MRHIHRLHRTQHGWRRDSLGKRTDKPYYVMKCVLSGCKYFIDVELALSRETLCNYCDNVFTLERRHLDLVRPHCGCRLSEDVFDKFLKEEVIK